MTRRRLALLLLLLPLGLLPALPAGAAGKAAPSAPRVEIVGSSFRVTRADGRVLSGPALVGTVLETADASGRRTPFRIDAVRPDPRDPSGETVLHEFSMRDGKTGRWQPVCEPDADGVRAGFPLLGEWTAGGEHVRTPTFTLACTSGAQGRCVRLGYKPWKTGEEGNTLWDHHQACTRAVRADYCGVGQASAPARMPVDIYDLIPVRRADPPGPERFEAGWGPAGAICVRTPREGADARCRRSAAGAGPGDGDACTEATAEAAGAVLFTRAPARAQAP